MISIRSMVPEDVAIFRDVRLRALRDTPNAFASTYARESQFTDEQWQSRARQWTAGGSPVVLAADQWKTGGSATFLAFDGAAACGIVACVKRDDAAGVFTIYSMWVAPEVRRQGVGRKLLQAAQSWAIAQGGVELVLDVTEGNTPAIECYKRFGFEFTGESDQYPNDPRLRELFMVKPL